MHGIPLASGNQLSRLRRSRSTPHRTTRRDFKGCCLILAGAGMCNAGRILHHLKRNLWRSETRVLIVSFQGYGSLGRRILERQPVVSIHGEKVVVRAQVHSLAGFSAHAGQQDLLRWLCAVAPSKPRVILTHREDKARHALSSEIRRRFCLATSVPRMGEIIEF